MTSVLIAGCGDLGSAVGRILVQLGRPVLGLGRGHRDLPHGIEPVRADLGVPAHLQDLPDVSAVVYCPTPDHRTDAAYRTTFVKGLSNLMQALPVNPDRRLVFVSSTAVYGQQDGSWVDEQSPAQADGFRGKILMEAETTALGYGGINLRLAGIYGPGRHWLLDRVSAGMKVPRNPDQWTNRIHRDDAAQMIVHLLTGRHFESGPVIGVDDEPATLWEVADWLARRTGAPAPVETAGKHGNKRLRNQRIKSTGFRFEYPGFRDGYEQVIRCMGS